MQLLIIQFSYAVIDPHAAHFLSLTALSKRPVVKKPPHESWRFRYGKGHCGTRENEETAPVWFLSCMYIDSWTALILTEIGTAVPEKKGLVWKSGSGWKNWDWIAILTRGSKWLTVLEGWPNQLQNRFSRHSWYCCLVTTYSKSQYQRKRWKLKCQNTVVQQ